MMLYSRIKLRPQLFYPARENIPFHFNPIKSVFPLIYSNSLLAKPRNNWLDFEGRKPFDDDHLLPVVGTKLSELSSTHKFSHWDQFINPQLTQDWKNLTPSPQYVGPRSGHLMQRLGWRKIGSSWKYARSYNKKRKGIRRGEWQQHKKTPRFMLAPRVCAGGPRQRYEGKAAFSRLPLSKVLWAIDNGRLNPNEVITLFHLRAARIIAQKQIVWPGFVLLSGNLEKIPYPIHIEMQSASAHAIQLIEEAGGTFTCVYMSHQGLYQQIRPQQFPIFLQQQIPQKRGLELFATNPARRGWLAQWYEDESKYAHPQAGRRSAHYIRPPTLRDFPNSIHQYEMVKHHQKWHLNQSGTGTILPWVLANTTDLQTKSTGKL